MALGGGWKQPSVERILVHPDDPLKGCHVETKTSTRIPPITVVESISCCISIIFYSYGEKDRTVADVVVLDYYLHRRRRLWDA